MIAEKKEMFTSEDLITGLIRAEILQVGERAATINARNLARKIIAQSPASSLDERTVAEMVLRECISRPGIAVQFGDE